MTAREAVKKLIRAYVLRGDTIKQLAYGYMGYCGSDYAAHIGGYMWRDADLGKPDGKPFKHLSIYQIGVESVGATEVMEVFSLKEMYQEIQREKQFGKQDQLALF